MRDYDLLGAGVPPASTCAARCRTTRPRSSPVSPSRPSRADGVRHADPRGDGPRRRTGILREGGNIPRHAELHRLTCVLATPFSGTIHNGLYRGGQVPVPGFITAPWMKSGGGAVTDRNDNVRECTPASCSAGFPTYLEYSPTGQAVITAFSFSRRGGGQRGRFGPGDDLASDRVERSGQIERASVGRRHGRAQLHRGLRAVARAPHLHPPLLRDGGERGGCCTWTRSTTPASSRDWTRAGAGGGVSRGVHRDTSVAPPAGKRGHEPASFP